MPVRRTGIGGAPFRFAGLWQRSTVREGIALKGSLADFAPGDVIETRTIFTTAANAALARVHHRMAVHPPERTSLGSPGHVQAHGDGAFGSGGHFVAQFRVRSGIVVLCYLFPYLTFPLWPALRLPAVRCIVIGALAPARCAPQRPVTASWRASFRGARPSPQVRFSVRALLVFRPRRVSSPTLFRIRMDEEPDRSRFRAMRAMPERVLARSRDARVALRAFGRREPPPFPQAASGYAFHWCDVSSARHALVGRSHRLPTAREK